ncbi:Gfo/Idh/MocA family protein [Faecalibacillus intestinalis]|nr:Gfo/Idh/MocA family oxidoreductase [Faecalibacillus intestinalis]
MKLGILGTGMIVKDVLTMYHELGVEKTYLFSTKKSKSQALELMKKYHLDKVYTDYDELLQSDVDTIYCALPNHLHYSFSKKALENGKNVIIEKPITANSKELEDLIEIASKNHLMIFEAMNLHYTPAFLSLKEDLNKLGDIKIVSFNYSQYSSRYNAFKKGTILPAFDYHKAGGALMDLNVYNIHALIDLFGKPVYHKYMANIEKNIDTSGMMLFDFDHFKALCIGAKDCRAPLMNTIQGNLGAIVVKSPLSQMTEYEICYNDGTSEVKSFEKKHRLIYEFKAFMKMMEEKDYKKQQEMLELSLLISKLMEEGRMQEGIVFDNDK